MRRLIIEWEPNGNKSFQACIIDDKRTKAVSFAYDINVKECTLSPVGEVILSPTANRTWHEPEHRDDFPIACSILGGYCSCDFVLQSNVITVNSNGEPSEETWCQLESYLAGNASY